MSIVELLTRRKREIDALVDTTYFRLMEETDGLLRLFPRTNYINRKLLVTRFNHNRPSVASIVAPEAEIPASRPRMTLSEELMSRCKIGKQIVWKEQDFELLNELGMYASQGGAQGSAMAQQIERHYFGAIADLVPAIYDRSLTIAIQIAVTGSCNFTDSRTGEVFNLAYSDLESTLFPSALTTTARWSQSATTVPLTNLEALADAYYDVNGSYAPIVVMSLKNFREVRNSTEVKAALKAMNGGDAADTTGVYVNDQAARDMILQRTRANELVIFDAEYTQENADGTETNVRYMPQDYVVLATPGMIEQAYVPTVERNFQAGIYQNSKVVNDAPRVERSVAVASCVPACFDRRKLCARKVN